MKVYIDMHEAKRTLYLEPEDKEDGEILREMEKWDKATIDGIRSQIRVFPGDLPRPEPPSQLAEIIRIREALEAMAGDIKKAVRDTETGKGQSH